MRVTIREPAAEGERFAPDAFASQIGKEMAVGVMGRQYGTGTLLSARVAGDGRSAELIVELPDPPKDSPIWALADSVSVPPMSFGFRADDPPHVITDIKMVSYGPVLDPPWKD